MPAFFALFLLLIGAVRAVSNIADGGANLRILPLGASIVWGQDSTDGNGFRLKLREMLEDHGNKVEYVGTVSHGNMTNNLCEAYPGHTISQVDRLALAGDAFDFKPNVILLHLGTNDCMRKAHENSTIAADHYGTLLENLQEKAPQAVVFASNLIHNDLSVHAGNCILHFNDQVPDIVARAKEQGQKVVLVDMNPAVPRADLNVKDKTHPTDAGYAIMARVWYESLVNSSSLIHAPDPISKPIPSTTRTVPSATDTNDSDGTSISSAAAEATSSKAAAVVHRSADIPLLGAAFAIPLMF
ncbi:carbohydrate esterase family 3 protein [Piedraia hortae CBS 480.64]|uniref:Carbohydrate esterase family 3 protein n=1 Tax=Piedraia hortae CBS 480.64 TaxID=1314780 RepID=A0A6A7BY07_9PEZI|nr:carbohydrate esterase family 3 protein [Piedraia hortae CBS 480.64]